MIVVVVLKNSAYHIQYIIPQHMFVDSVVGDKVSVRYCPQGSNMYRKKMRREEELSAVWERTDCL